MTSAQTPHEKLAAVREAYFSRIVPGIQRVYERTNQVRECFILAHCAILSLSGFYAGKKHSNGSTYRSFIRDFFPRDYNADGLWKDLRNSLVHAYTLTSAYILTHKHPEKHLCQVKGLNSERTGKCTDLTYLNFEDFFDDFREAAQPYFARATTEPDLTNKLSARHDIAPPDTYISDKEIAQYVKARTRHKLQD